MIKNIHSLGLSLAIGITASCKDASADVSQSTGTGDRETLSSQSELAKEPETPFVSLFDGKTMNGWNLNDDSEKKWWGVRDGMLVGGSMTQNVPRNIFLVSDKSYQNFELKFKVRLVKGKGFANSGVQIRSQRDNKSMKGYQVDAGIKWWGVIYDEHRRNKAIAKPINPKEIAEKVHDWDWNEYHTIADGGNIKTYINGVLAHDYHEDRGDIALDGFIGLQCHSGGTYEVQYKDLEIKELAPTPNAPTWESLKKDAVDKKEAAKRDKKNASKLFTPQSAEKERKGFHLPEGFEAELVADETVGAGKPITVTWDTRGRMWTMTAYEYPVDANENKAQAEALFAKGGRDKVLIFDNPYRKGPIKPRVFAENLVIPLGLLPVENGAYVQYGNEIRFYNDKDNDGKSEDYKVVLEGFGIQDSHLFPHQFERTSGGWIYAAQGLFNYSKPRRPNGLTFADGTKEKRYMQTKLARFRPDGSMWENVSAGPNNIWGLIMKNNGETFIQEANDMKIPVVEYMRGTYFKTSSRERLKSYIPRIPESTIEGMGGTGLSGLALTEDPNSPFNLQYGGKENVFFVINPITNKIQVVSAIKKANNQYHYVIEKDFMTSDDKMFRPVAGHFGPDGCLYIVDWYNKIISHNEVPRSHPDRDKVRGRIWRIKPKGSTPTAPPNLMEIPEKELLVVLESNNERLARLAWHAITDRKAVGLTDSLVKLVLDPTKAVNARVLALWSLEEMRKLTVATMTSLSTDQSEYIRFEVARALSEISVSPSDFMSIAKSFPTDKSYRVRAELANTLRTLTKVTPEMIYLAAKLGNKELKTGTKKEKYNRNFERAVARWAMENHRPETVAMLESTDGKSLNTEQKILAILSLAPKEAATQLVSAISEMDRALNANELSIISSQIHQPNVLEEFTTALSDPKQQRILLTTMISMDAKVAANPALRKVMGNACKQFITREKDAEKVVLPLASKFRLRSLESDVNKWLAKSKDPNLISKGLLALSEMGSQNKEIFEKYLVHGDADVQRKALIGLAKINDVSIVDYFASKWDAMNGASRQLVINGLTSNKKKATGLADAILAGKYQGITGDSLENIFVILGAKHPKVTQILTKIPGLMQSVIRLNGNNKDIVKTQIDLKGPFTLEAWVKLDSGISNEDVLVGNSNGKGVFNFHDQKFRVFAGRAHGDSILAKRQSLANVWTHYAITRDSKGIFRVYIDGELDNVGKKPVKDDLLNLDIGANTVRTGSAMSLRELRVWDHARSKNDIIVNYNTDYTGANPKGLVKHISGESKLDYRGRAKSELVSNFPKLVTPAEAQAAKAKFDKYLRIASKKGDKAKGSTHFVTCLACHKVGNTGGTIGPDLSGIGAMSTEAQLHNILTPNAKMESGYYRHDVITKTGKISGTLVEETATTISIQPAGGEVVVINKKQVLKHNVSKSSLMPEGLIDHLSDDQVADLFEYMRSLKK